MLKVLIAGLEPAGGIPRPGAHVPSVTEGLDTPGGVLRDLDNIRFGA